MSGMQFTFSTDGFCDDDERRTENVNGIVGHSLATYLVAKMRQAGFDASDVWAEDHGWDFSVAHPGGKYLCACSIDDNGEGSPEANIVVDKSRSVWERLTGGNAMRADDPVADAIRAVLTASPDVKNLTSS
jgi:hypothetical protein